MLWSFLLVAWFCGVHGGPVDTQRRDTDIQYDEGRINILRTKRHPHKTRPSETVLDFEDDYAVLEGDILLPSDRNAVKQLWGKVDGNLSVPYEIDPVLVNKIEDIHKAFKMISEKTCIRFSEHATETDYLHFEPGKGCASFVGCVGGEQSVVVGPRCTVGNLCHEVLHSLGLYHEQSRYDRDDHITVIYENISPVKRHNFVKQDGDTLGLKYDLESILHYGNNYFSHNGKPTIQSKASGVKIGQRTHLSDLDVQRLRKLYHCDKREKFQAKQP